MSFPKLPAESIFNGPALPEPLPNGGDMHTKLPGQVSHARRFSIYGNKCASCGISRLLCGCRPAAVVLKITQIVIAPVDRQAKWALTHVVKEVLKGLLPAFTHCNSSPCVSFVAFAPLPHVDPYAVCLGYGSVNSGTVRDEAFTAPVPLQATARFAKPVQQARAASFKFRPAVTAHDTPRLSVSVNSISDYDTSCKSRSGRDNLSGRHNNGIDVVVFSGGRTGLIVRQPRFCQILSGGQED